MSKNILLVDSRVQNYETIINAVNTDAATAIVFDYRHDTISDIKIRILAECSGSSLPQSPSTKRCIGLIQHNYGTPFYHFVATPSDLAVEWQRQKRRTLSWRHGIPCATLFLGAP